MSTNTIQGVKILNPKLRMCLSLSVHLEEPLNKGVVCGLLNSKSPLLAPTARLFSLSPISLLLVACKLRQLSLAAYRDNLLHTCFKFTID